MFSSQTTILDLGASRVALGGFTRKGGRLRLDSHAVETFPIQTVGDGQWLGQTAAALRTLRGRFKSGGPVGLVLPAHLTFASATGGGVNAANTVSWTLATLAPGASGSVTVTATVDAVMPAGTTTLVNVVTAPTGACATAADCNQNWGVR